MIKLIPLLLVLASCSSTVVKKIGPQSKYAPKNYQEKGLVEYLNAGGSWIVESRREDAFKTMYESCGGEYEITREGPKTSMVATANSFDHHKWMIEYRCSMRTPASN